MNHYYLSSSNVTILNIIIRHLPKVSPPHTDRMYVNEDLENSKEYITIMNYVYQLQLKERFESIGIKKCIGSQFMVTCGYNETNQNDIHSTMSLIIEFLFAIQEKINDFNDKMNTNCSICASM